MHVIVKFETRYPVGKEPQDWVLLAPQGEEFERTQTWHRVKTLMPPEDADATLRQSDKFKAMELRWSIVGPAYEAFKKGSEIPESGTPLAAWGGVNGGQIEVLRRMGIRSVEDVAAMSDGAQAKLNWPEARQLPKLAQAYLDSKGDVEKDAKIAEMAEKLAAMEELLQEQMDSKPKRGRPKKEAEAA